MGNTLEFFDLYLYIHLAHIINQKFFPTGDPSSLHLLSLMNLYFVAPVASILFAYVGDKYGRREVIVKASMVMAITSVLIVFLPTYETWGPNAGWLLMFLRIFQGIALSGEPIAANLFVIEEVPLKKAPLWINLLGTAECLGGMLALGLGIFSIHYFSDYEHGWRIPFAAGGIFIVFIWWMRKHLRDSREYVEATSDLEDNIAQHSIKQFYQSLEFKTRNFFCSIGIWMHYPIAFTIVYIQLTEYLTKNLGLSQKAVMTNNLYVSAVEATIPVLIAWIVTSKDIAIKKAAYFFILLEIGLALSASSLIDHYPGQMAITLLQMSIMILGTAPCAFMLASFLKTFSVIGRFTLMTSGWGVAKIISFFLTGMIMDTLVSFWGINGMMVVLALGCVIALICVYLHVPFKNLNDMAIKKMFKKSIPVPQDASRVLTKEALERDFLSPYTERKDEKAYNV